MKKQFIILALGAAMAASCADEFNTSNYAVDRPAKTAEYAYLNDYMPLKQYVSNPDFKLGIGTTVSDYLQKELVYALTNSNFNETVAGNAMKMASCVNSDNGSMDFSTVSEYVNTATEAGLSVYGHTLAWHAQQPVKWLNSLLKDKELDIDPDAKIETLINTMDYGTMADGPFPHYPMGCEPPIINGALHFVPTGAWSQFFVVPGGDNQLDEGDYVFYVDMAADKDASGVQLTVQNGWGNDAQNFSAAVPVEAGRHTYALKFPGITGSPSKGYDCILKPQTADATLDFYSLRVCKIEKLNSIPLTPEEKKDTLTWAMDRWIAGMMEACDGKVKAWDVVNEAISGGNADSEGVYALQHGSEGNTTDFFWQDYLDDYDYVRTAVRLARQYGPEDIKLFINDYNLESDWDQNGKLRSLIAWIKRWESDGQTRIDGIGSQMHISCYADAKTQESKKNAITNMFKLMAASGKLCRISELDMGYVDANGNSVATGNMTEEQHKQMAELYNFVIKSYLEIIPAAQQWGICQWCATDAPTDSGWRGGEPVGLWDINYYRKHTYAGFADGLAGE